MRTEPTIHEPAAECALYANYFQVGHNAFEFFVDFGQRFDTPESLSLHTRIIVTPAHAKGLLELLQDSLSQFDRTHGDPQEGR